MGRWSQRIAHLAWLCCTHSSLPPPLLATSSFPLFSTRQVFDQSEMMKCPNKMECVKFAKRISKNSRKTGFDGERMGMTGWSKVIRILSSTKDPFRMALPESHGQLNRPQVAAFSEGRRRVTCKFTAVNVTYSNIVSLPSFPLPPSSHQPLAFLSKIKIVPFPAAPSNSALKIFIALYREGRWNHLIEKYSEKKNVSLKN